ncbi:hypothetical protein Lalb_Chr16g0378051 [Lupinus albus]|uniref:Uncharacterized protein n=1 Tax=Lupinus albus TaxID=3870 RepID=A0A6A4PC27_LUPAL|nr:hypothetical protein Lalb_Chr16g0378051 [Lupinus albus]
MNEVPGSFGTIASFALRFGQTVFSSSSLLLMFYHIDFFPFTAFLFLSLIQFYFLSLVTS